MSNLTYTTADGQPLTELEFWARSALRAAYRMVGCRGPAMISWLK